MKFIPVLLIWTLVSIEETVACQFVDSVDVDGICYRYDSAIGNWNSAKSLCASWGGALAEVSTSAQVSYLLGFSSDPNVGIWIGATDQANYGTWIWDYSGKSALVSGLWSGGAPLDTDGSCAIVFITFASSGDCDMRARVMCMELPQTTVTQPSDSTSSMTSTTSTVSQSSNQETTVSTTAAIYTYSTAESSALTSTSSTKTVEGSTTILTTQILTSSFTPALTSTPLSSTNQPTAPTSTQISTYTPATSSTRMVYEMTTSSARRFTAVSCVTFSLSLLVSAYLTNVN